jgi:hypothetical protein
MIRVRDDDVLVHSSGYSDAEAVARFKRVHEIIVNGGGLHVPAVLIMEILDFPEAIEFIGEETKAGRMEPQWHGMEHVDYAKKTEEEIVADIIMSQLQFREWFDCKFTKFYTPWGANAAHIKKACDRLNVEMVDCSDIIRCVHVNREPEKFRGKDIEIMIHWWEGVGRLRDMFHNLGETNG